MKLKYLALLGSFIFFSNSAQAGFYLEPMVGYNTGTLDYKVKDAFGGSEDKGTQTGIGYGLGAGWNFDSNWVVGLDAQFANVKTKLDTAGTESDAKTQAIYLVGGYWFEKINGLFVGIGSVQSEDDSSKLTGTTLKLGISRKFKEHIVVNAEYVLYTIVDSETDGTTTKIADFYDRFNSTALIFNVRFPFDIGGR